MIHWRIETYDILDSTNTELRKLADSGADEGLVIQALMQKNGKGRHGNYWFSPENGLYLSFLLKPEFSGEIVNLISLTIGLAVAEVIESETSLSPSLKWPNDIYLSRKKAGGILIETKFKGDKILYAICGLGLNFNQATSQFPPEILKTSTSLFMETGKIQDQVLFVEKLLNRVDRYYSYLKDGKESGIIERYSSFSLLDGKSVKINDDKLYKGKVIGISARGSLKIMTDKGIKEFFSGSIVEISD